jgi:hypothetical protein
MFKTNSRKGLGLASIVALVGSLIIGVTPAQAAGEANLATAKGTTYAALAGTTFELSVNAGSSIPASSWGTLKTRITLTSGSSYSATASATTGTTFTGNVNVTKSSTVLAPNAVSTTLSAYTVAISTETSASDAVITVQTWLDANGDGLITPGENVSEIRTITFYKTSAVTWQTAFTAPLLSPAAQTLSAVVSTAEGINMAQLAADKVQVAFATVSGTAYTTIGTATSSSDGVYITGENTAVPTGTNTRLGKTTGVTVVASSTYMAVAVVDGIEVGGEQYAVVGAAAVANIDNPEITVGANTKEGLANNGEVRSGAARSIELVAAVSKSAGVKAAVGTLVTVTVTEGTLTSVSAVVGGGKTLANLSSTTSEKIEFTVAVDADGEVTIPLATTLKNNETFTVLLSAGSAQNANAFTITAKDTAYASIVDLTTFGSGSVVKVTTGTSASLKFGILDNFGVALTGDYRVVLKSNKGLTTQSANVVGSEVTFAVTPTTTTEFYAQVQQLNKATLAFDDKLAAATRSVTVGASTAPANVTVVASSASNLVINNSRFFAVDTRLGATAPKLTTGNRATLSGQVTNASGIATYGVVTLSAPNVMFAVGEVFTLGSVTVETNATGAYEDVVVYSNTAGKVSVSATVGAATKDLGLTFLPAADTTGAKWVITAPSNVLPGSTAQFKAQLLDTWSNPVKVVTTSKIAVTYTGPGFVTAALPNTTDADGMLSFSVLFGAADTGTATVKFSYDGDGVATTTADNIATSVTTTIGAAAASATDQKLTVGSFKGFVAIYALNYTGQKLSAKVAGKWLTVNNLSRFQRVVRNTGAAIPIVVDLYIDGKFVRTENIVTK